MKPTRRAVTLGLASSFLTPPVFAQARFGASAWVQIAEVLGDVGHSLAAFSESVGQIADQAMSGHDRWQRRSVRAALIKTSARVTAVIADQEKVEPALNRYGDLWRRGYRRGYQMSPSEQNALELQWRVATDVVKSIASATTALLKEIQGLDSDIVLEDSYLDLEKALSAKTSVLNAMSRMSAPSNPDELKELVKNEETFDHLRIEAQGALSSLNRAIKAIKT